jgi:hypothetical protein
MQKMAYDIFISYRRRFGTDMAGRIQDRLVGQGYSVFYDLESMHEGKFNEQIKAAIRECTDFILVLPPEALDRCVNKDDWVRQEIEMAFELNKNIIPVAMEDFVDPDWTQMPEGIRDLEHLERVRVVYDYFGDFVNKLVGMLHTPKPAFSSTNGKNLIQEGIRALQHRQYQQAKTYMDEAMRSDISNAQVHFYYAVVLLEAKRPFLSNKQVINRIVDCLEVANEIQEEAIYHYLLSYVKYDYHHSKMLRANPDYLYHLQKARELGITDKEIQSLFALLRVPAPAGV